ncbi:MAG: UbiX family flavin prenyltransferase [Negativicutes bacterium]|nr:UbiX family flavin prenyltransferase [Negativicutes bacterium]
MKVVVGVTGASGIIYAIRLLEVLQQQDVEVHLVFSEWAGHNLSYETNKSLAEIQALARHFYNNGELAAPIASGSFRMDAMVVVPCSMKSLAAIAHGFSDSLIVRAADVMLKERRKLILVPRESPLSVIHLGNMLAVAQAGAVILPPMPAFYGRPQTLDDVIDQTVARILDQLGLDNELSYRWGS